MWTRAELKSRAKAVLRGNYWKAFLISLVIAFTSGGGGGSSGGRVGGRTGDFSGLDSFRPSSSETAALVVLIIFIVLFSLAIGFGIKALLMNPLHVGGRRYFTQSAQYFDNRGCFRFAFDGFNWKGIVGSMFLMDVFVFLWTLLFIIPGIIKARYSYRMVPYILADNPNIGAKRAIDLSRAMMNGHKFDTFVLDLSFIGWVLLTIFTFGIGMLFLNPYIHATDAELYLVLRQNAIENGLCSLSELNLYYPGQEEYNF